MSPITVSFTKTETQRITERAKECGMTAEELVHLSVASALDAEPDDFEEIKAYLLNKYDELYRRLA